MFQTYNDCKYKDKAVGQSSKYIDLQNQNLD